MKRFLAILAAALIVVSGLSAAGRRSSSSTGVVTLKMLNCWNGGLGVLGSIDWPNTAVAKYLAEKTGVMIEWEGIMMRETEKLNLMFASGDMPDIVNGANWGGNGGESGIIKKAAQEGMLLPIDQYITGGTYPEIERAFQIGVISQNYWETEINAPEFGGHVYLIPQEVVGNEGDLQKWDYGIAVRRDVGPALGIDPRSIRTADQLYDFMVKARDYGFKDINGNDTIVATTRHEGWDYPQFSRYYTHSRNLTSYVQKPDGTVSADALEQLWIDRNLFIWKMVANGILDVECFRTDDTLADTKIGNGTALMMGAHLDNWAGAQFKTGVWQTTPEFRYTWVGPMNDIDGNRLAQVETNGRTGTPVVFFPNTCKDIEAAMRYINYVNTREGRMAVVYGTPEMGLYRINEDGYPIWTGEYDRLRRIETRPEGWDKQWKDQGLGEGMSRLHLANMDFVYFTKINDIKQERELLKDAYFEEYRIAVIPGYPLNALESSAPEYAEVTTLGLQEIEKTYRERAYFAATEAEARRILQDYQNYLRTVNNGIYMRYLASLTQLSKSRPDIVF
jgi:putative aldouronate transport system substrate-binding protein